jgi:hypothetical protein
MKHDKHAHAYDVLLNDRSRMIARNLAKPTGQLKEAHEDERCLACHSIPAMDYKELERFGRVKDGVSCESCHGPAEKWLVEHTTLSWRRRQPEEKERLFGMTNTKDLAGRAQLCAGCHVGAPEDAKRGEPLRDALHDIMAAGHPRLAFEFGNFFARMPRHWVEKDNEPDFEVRAWVVGQVASAHAALRLLEARAAASQKGSPWPEFAEYDCFACHHDLHEPSWRQERGYSQRKPGAMPWGAWFLPMTRVLAAKQGYQELIERLEGIEMLMSDHPHRDTQAVADQARSAAELLGGMLRQVAKERFTPTAARQLASACIKDGEKLVESNWDAATQLYLALVALNETLKDDRLKAALETMLKKLDFPPNYESPRHFRKGFRPDHRDAFESELKIIRQQIGQ